VVEFFVGHRGPPCSLTLVAFTSLGFFHRGSKRSFSTESAAGSTDHCNTALSLSAGVSNPNVFLGRWLRRNAILFKYDCE